jgi:hypothetical protein
MSMDPLKCWKNAAGIDVEEPSWPVSIFKRCPNNRAERAWNIARRPRAVAFLSHSFTNRYQTLAACSYVDGFHSSKTSYKSLCGQCSIFSL